MVAKAAKSTKAAKKFTAPMTKEERVKSYVEYYSTLPVGQLKGMCAAQGLELGGSQQDLVMRLADPSGRVEAAAAAKQTSRSQSPPKTKGSNPPGSPKKAKDVFSPRAPPKPAAHAKPTRSQSPPKKTTATIIGDLPKVVKVEKEASSPGAAERKFVPLDAAPQQLLVPTMAESDLAKQLFSSCESRSPARAANTSSKVVSALLCLMVLLGLLAAVASTFLGPGSFSTFDVDIIVIGAQEAWADWKIRVTSALPMDRPWSAAGLQ